MNTAKLDLDTAIASEPLIVGEQTVFFQTSEDMSCLPDRSVDFVLTSPPYWDLKDYGGGAKQIGQESYEHYLQRLDHVWAECYRVCRENGVMVINVKSRRRNKHFYPIALDIYARMQNWRLWDIMIWYIPNALPQPNHYMHRLFDDKFEYLLVFIKGDPDSYTFHKPRIPQKYFDAEPRKHKLNVEGRCLGNVVRIPAYRPPNVKSLGYHAAAYPEELAALLIHTYTNSNGTVLDPFLGSGTTLKIARVMGRKGYGFEINAQYKKLIEKRINEYWELPDWREIDILNASSKRLGSEKPRKIHFHRLSTQTNGNGRLFDDEEPF